MQTITPGCPVRIDNPLYSCRRMSWTITMMKPTMIETKFTTIMQLGGKVVPQYQLQTQHRINTLAIVVKQAVQFLSDGAVEVWMSSTHSPFPTHWGPHPLLSLCILWLLVRFHRAKAK